MMLPSVAKDRLFVYLVTWEDYNLETPTGTGIN